MEPRSIDDCLAAGVERGSLVGISAAVWSASGLRFEAAHGTSAPGRPMRVDSIAWIASMTKAVTAVAVLQLVDRQLIDLDQPAGDLVPYLNRVQVLDGFADDGSARLRPPVRPVTIRHLLTHTSGFGYDWSNAALAQFAPSMPVATAGSQAGYESPLVADPGESWSYGIGVDWAGRVVEAASGTRLDRYFREEILDPLGMADTGFAVPAANTDRVCEMHRRTDDGLEAMTFGLEPDPEMFMAGGGLYSTTRDYLRFTRMLLAAGELDGHRVIDEATTRLMFTNQLGRIAARGWQSFNPVLSNDVELTPDGSAGWSVGFMVDTQPSAEGRSAGSVSWGGLANTYCWIDPTAELTGVFITQVLPFYDQHCLDIFSRFQREVYANVHSGAQGTTPS